MPLGLGPPSAAPQPDSHLCDPRQVKIMTEKELLAVACEQFLGKNVQDIKNVVLQTLEGHLRSILGEALPSPGSLTRSPSHLRGGDRAGRGGSSSPSQKFLDGTCSLKYFLSKCQATRAKRRASRGE